MNEQHLSQLVPPDNQLKLVQLCMQKFVEDGQGEYQIFCKIWRENDISSIHGYSSPRPLIYSPFQAAVSAFLGYLYCNPTLLEFRGLIYGLYLLYSTQKSPSLYPLFLNSHDLLIITQFIKNNKQNVLDCITIIQFLFKNNAIILTSQPIANFSNPSAQSLHVLKNKILFSHVQKWKKDTLHNEEEELISLDDIKAQYDSLTSSIFKE